MNATIVNIRPVEQFVLSCFVRKADGDEGRRTLRFPLSETTAVGITQAAVIELGYAIDGNQSHLSVPLDELRAAQVALSDWAASYHIAVEFK